MVDELNIQADVSGKSEDAPDEQTQTDRPEWLPEKFKSAEELAKVLLLYFNKSEYNDINEFSLLVESIKALLPDTVPI